MSTLFELEDLARRAGVTPTELGEFERCIREQYGEDDMLVELRLLRTLQAIAAGATTKVAALIDIQDEPSQIELDALVARCGLAGAERDQVRSTLRTHLSREQRLILALIYYEQKSTSDVAGVLGIGLADVERLHADALARLQARLSPDVSERLLRRAS